MKKFLLLSALLLTALPSYSQDNFQPIDSIVKVYEGKVAPGFAVRILKDGKTVYNNHAGYANLEQHTKISDESVFNLASISKQFTASAIVLLQQRGKLNLNDNLRKYIPEFPAYAEKITLLHLLTHTGGLKDYPILAEIKGETSANYTNAQIKALLVLQQPDFEPGTKWSYSNTGYWCLAQIVEKVSGKTITEFARKNIFRPLGMKNTAYITKPKNTVKNKATGYANKNGAYAATDPDNYTIGGGGVYSTLGDLQKWLTEMQSHRIFGDAFWKSMTEDDMYKSEEVTYTKGLFISPYGSKTMIDHGGDVEGYHPFIAYFPEDKVGAIVLTNDDNFKRYEILRASVNRLLGFKYRYPAKKDNALSKAADLSLYTGSYKLDEGQYMLIQENNGMLTLTQLWNGINVQLEPTADAHNFALTGNEGTFVFDDIQNGKAQSVLLKQGGEITTLMRMEQMPENADLIAYEGNYFCTALNQSIKIFTKEGLIYFTLANGTTDWAIQSEGETFATRYGDFSFKKDATGKVTAFIYDHERAKNLEFIKQ